MCIVSYGLPLLLVCMCAHQACECIHGTEDKNNTACSSFCNVLPAAHGAASHRHDKAPRSTDEGNMTLAQRRKKQKANGSKGKGQASAAGTPAGSAKGGKAATAQAEFYVGDANGNEPSQKDKWVDDRRGRPGKGPGAVSMMSPMERMLKDANNMIGESRPGMSS